MNALAWLVLISISDPTVPPTFVRTYPRAECGIRALAGNAVPSPWTMVWKQPAPPKGQAYACVTFVYPI